MSQVVGDSWAWGGDGKLPGVVQPTGTMSGTNKINGNPMMIERGRGASLTAISTGTPTGAYGAEVSNMYDPLINPNPPDWIALPAGMITKTTDPAGAGGTSYVEVAACNARAIRFIYTNASGAGTITNARQHTKGA